MTAADSISVIVPAYNEAEGLAATVDEIVAAVEGDFADYEVLIFDDCSSDGTAEAADRIGATNPHVRVVHNAQNQGLGWNFRTGLQMARMTYVTLVNGKHDIEADQLRRIFALRGRADVIVPYHTNRHERPLSRQLVSRTFTTLLNLLFARRLHYYNDSVLHRTEMLRQFKLHTDSYAFTAECLIKALDSGCSFVEVPIRNLYPPGIKTSAFRARNFVGVAKFLGSMVRDVHFTKGYRRG